MKAFVIAALNLRRMFRDRAAIFFVIIFPMLLILLLPVLLIDNPPRGHMRLLLWVVMSIAITYCRIVIMLVHLLNFCNLMIRQ